MTQHQASKIQTQGNPTLERRLENRHIQLLSIGGAIGTGLFMGSGKIIALSGTSILLVYAILGFFVFLVMRALGELLLSNLGFKSFADIATHYLGPQTGFIVSWSYWFAWSIAAVGDMVMMASFVQYWFPTMPTGTICCGIIATLTIINMMAVRIFGEVEFWFGLIKILAICLLIVTGVMMVAMSFTSPNGTPASFSHLLQDGAVFPHGLSGFLAGFQIAVYSFTGTEMIGTAAAEAKNPERTLPRAINAIPWRIVLFYVLSIACIISVVSWKEVPISRSPFVELFVFAGLPAAAGMVNFVVLTAAMSAANSGLYSCGRMLFGLSAQKRAPQWIGKLSKLGTPVHAVLFTSTCMLIGLALLWVVPEAITLFTLLSTITAVITLFTWSVIMASYLAYRKRDKELHERSNFKMPGGIATAYLTIVFLVFIACMFTMEDDTRTGLCIAPLWFGILIVTYRKYYKRVDEMDNPEQEHLEAVSAR
ncbi:amino acid permease [Pantoea sp. Ap-967]|uniref:amino acid permease n=1 Tax=Pantoea sp. Ap-967 TaxID=2608362 RepID=UPI001423A0FF|nr:amino acid permease [Pantoea sp. Ap-967]NIE77153.1 amino acid permease [Pantoea sp. Ap-967]